MRHRKLKYHLSRSTSFRRATLISLARNLFIHQSIRTTKTRAKAVRPLVEKLITLGKQGTLSAKRRAYKVLGDHRLVSRLFSDIALRFKDTQGGHIRILGLGRRRGDDAELALLELTEIKKLQKKEKAAKAPEKLPEEKQKETPEQHKHEVHAEEKPSIAHKPPKKFLGGIRNIFKKKSDSL